MVKVIRMQPLEEGWQQRAAAPFAAFGLAPAKSLPLPNALFPMEGFADGEEEATAQTAPAGVSEAAARARTTVQDLLHPASAEDHAVFSAALMGMQAGNGNLEAIGKVLARVGYTVRLHTSGGGSLYRLRHRYLTATRNSAIGEPAEWVIDPSFAAAFAVTFPTTRYTHVLTAVPAVLAAPLPRLVRALLVLGAELALCFEENGVPLPPWRHVDSLASKYDATASVLVHSSDAQAVSAAEEAAAKAAGVAPHAVAPAVVAAAFARKQQHDQQELEHVRLRLARLGLLPEQPEPAQVPCCSSPSNNSGQGDSDSPRSVLTPSPTQLLLGSRAASRTQAIHQRTAGMQCLCCRWRPTAFQPERRPTHAASCRLQQPGVAVASAA